MEGAAQLDSFSCDVPHLVIPKLCRRRRDASPSAKGGALLLNGMQSLSSKSGSLQLGSVAICDARVLQSVRRFSHQTHRERRTLKGAQGRTNDLGTFYHPYCSAQALALAQKCQSPSSVTLFLRLPFLLVSKRREKSPDTVRFRADTSNTCSGTLSGPRTSPVDRRRPSSSPENQTQSERF